MNRKIILLSLLLFSLTLCLMNSCQRTTSLLIFDGNKYHKEYKLEIGKLEYKLNAKLEYGLIMDLELFIEIENKSYQTITYDFSLFKITSKVLNFKDINFYFINDESSQKNEKKVLIIKPGKKILINGSVYTEEMSVDESRKLWPWPKNENVKVDLGSIVKGENEIPLQSVFFTHQSVVEK